MGEFYTQEQRLGGGGVYVYVLRRRQVQHSRSLGMALVPCVKSFFGRTTTGVARARRNAERLAARLNNN